VSIDILGPGATGLHSFKKVNIDTDENFIYYRDGNIPSEVIDGKSYIYSNLTGEIGGVSDKDLVYTTILSNQVLRLRDSDQETISFTGFSQGDVAFNEPIVYDNILNIGMSTPTNQAVKYFTTQTPITGLVSGETYFLKNVPADFVGTQSLYQITGNTHTFTTCGQTGRVGPNQTQILSGYSTNWHSTYLKRGDFDGYQDWTVPVSGVYEFTASGAAGFSGVDQTRTINQTSLTSNIARIRTTTAHNLSVGFTVTISGATNTVYNGTYTVLSVLSTTEFTYSRTNANIAQATSVGTVTIITTPGRGVRLRGRVTLTRGETITIAVGQRGAAPESGGIWGGSGGGTFIVRKSSNEPILVAGGGAADANLSNGLDAVLTTRGGNSQSGAAGGIDGGGGIAVGGNSGAGGGFFSRGQDSVVSGVIRERGGGSFLDGLTATDNGVRVGGNGGFGGGASSDGTNSGQSGGGGGYSGGAGARVTTANQSGGGGGSFASPLVTQLATSDGTYETLTTFQGQSITNLNSYNTGEGSVIVSLVESFTGGNEVYPTALDAQNGTNKIAIEPAGNSFHSLVPANYDFVNDAIHSPSSHTLTDGQAIKFNFLGTTPLGIQNNTIYYASVINSFTFKLSLTPISSPTIINLTVPSGRPPSGSDSFSRVVVNTSLNTLTISNHGFLVDQPVLYDVGGGTPISPLQNGVTYYIAQVVDANNIRLKTALDAPTPINLLAEGTGTTHSFLFVSVNTVENTLYIANHGLVSGQAVRYQVGSGNDPIGGLVDGTTYYVIRVDNSLIRLSPNPTLTPIVNLTSVGTGTQTIVITSLNFTTNVITLPSHGFTQGELVEYDSKGQTEISGLTTATPYYVIFVDGDNIKLATTPENASAGIEVDIQESPAGVGVHSIKSLSKTPDGIYTVETVPTPNTFTVRADGNVPVITKIFNPRSTVDPVSDTFKIASHGFITGTRVTYQQGESATDIEGLVDDTDYFVVAVNRDYLKLSTTAENAAAGVTISVEGFGTGIAHRFVSAQINGNITGAGSVSVGSGSVLVNGVGTSFSKILKVGDRFQLYPPNVENEIVFAAADISTVTNRITKAHTFETGDSVVFITNGGVAPTPLINNYYYFVRAISSTEITLHASASDAETNTNPVNFSTQGEGTEFKLTNTQPVSPINRKITAVGSDLQVTVDRPYASSYSGVSYSYPTFVYVRPEGYALHRPFDGGVEMSVGSGTSFGQIIRQTRKYFRYQSGKGLQTSFGINFKPSIDLESMIKFSETTIECKTRNPHGLVSGLFIEISQAEDSFGTPSSVYNGVFQVTFVDLNTFRISASSPIVENRAYGFPQFYVQSWTNGALRAGMFDFQNGMFFEFDGEKLYAVRRSSTQQMAGTASALQGSELILGTNTQFVGQLKVGDFVVMRGQSYKVVEIESDTRMSVRPEYKGASGAIVEFDPDTVVDTSTNTFTIIGHGFGDGLPVIYDSIDGNPIGGLVNGNTYYVDLINNNNFKLLPSPDSETNVNLSSKGTTNLHSFTPAKSGIIITKTVDVKVPQEDWSLDPLDGSGPTGYNLDLSRIQMAYIDYSWYGAGKIRFGFKTADGQVQYVHEFVHNNQLYESYFRSGNLPGRYEVVTNENPTYIPFLFHWGTSVMMDGRFDDDRAYLFTATSQTLEVRGTTTKAFASTGINISNDLVTVRTHGFKTGDVVEFESIAPNGLRGENSLNPATQIIGSQTLANLTNSAKYKIFVNSPDRVHLTPRTATITLGATFARSGSTVTVTTAQAHNIPSSNYVGIYNIGITNIPDFYVGAVTVTNTTTFTYTVAGSQTVTGTVSTTAAISEVVNFTDQGNSQYTYFLYPEGSLGNTSGPNYQPLISLRLSPSVSSGLTGRLGDRDVINRMQLRLQEVGISTNELVDVKLLLNPRLNNLNFQGVPTPSLTQIIQHTAADTVSGGVQVYRFRSGGGSGGTEGETTVDVDELFELSNSILGGDSVYPDGPDIITIAVSRLTGNETLASAKLSWAEAQA
jgi:hypothetical protein